MKMRGDLSSKNAGRVGCCQVQQRELEREGSGFHGLRGEGKANTSGARTTWEKSFQDNSGDFKKDVPVKGESLLCKAARSQIS